MTQLATRGVDALDPYFARYLPQLVLAAWCHRYSWSWSGRPTGFPGW